MTNPSFDGSHSAGRSRWQPVARLLASACLAALVATTAEAEFPIAVSTVAESTSLNPGMAFDGTNFLVGIQQQPAGPSVVGAQLVSPAGMAVGSFISTGRSGDPPVVAFDGTNYLLAWKDYAPGPGPVYGALVSKAGALVGPAFPLSQSTTVEHVTGVAFDGTNYLVVWADNRRAVMPPQPGDKDVYGRFVSTGGAPVGSDFKISTGAGIWPGVAHGAPNHLVVWNEDVLNTEVRGRFVTPAGVLLTEFSVNASAAMSDAPLAVAFAGTEFLVAWSDETSAGNMDLLAQRVLPDGSITGSVITVSEGPGWQVLPSIAYDGVNWLVSFIDARNDANVNFACDAGEATCLDVYGQFVSTSGLVGAPFVINADAGDQGVSPVAFGAGRYLVAWSSGPDFKGDVFGRFVKPGSVQGVDFDGDVRADHTVYHSASGLWYTRYSSSGASDSVAFGGPDYTPVPGDYDGDGNTDVAAYHGPSGTWYISETSTGTTVSVGYGGPGYAPVRGDFDGDRKSDVAVFHAASGLWFIRQSTTGTTFSMGYGGADYVPVPADYDGDGKADLAVYHPPTGLWFTRSSATGTTTTLGFGGTGYNPVRGDFDGDRKGDIAVYHPASGLWFIRQSSTSTTMTVGYGGSEYLPVPGDFDGDAKTDIAAYHPPTGLWFVRQSSTGTTVTTGFGGSGFAAVN